MTGEVRVVFLHDKDEIEAYLRREPELHLYEIGDLDPFFLDYTLWYGLRRGEALEAVVLLYYGMSLPVMLALSEQSREATANLLALLAPHLPPSLYTHISPGLNVALAERGFRLSGPGKHYKMALKEPERLQAIDASAVTRLGPEDGDSLERLYRESYPGNSFDRRMLETGHFYGVKEGDEIISVAGVHVFSSEYRVAALGNVATHPRYRRKGLGTMVTARLCRQLMPLVDHIGLNVRVGNLAACRCYEALGFRVIASYEEMAAERRLS